MKEDISISEHLKSLEEKLLDPNFRKLPEEAASLLSEDFMEIGSSGKIYNKKETMVALANESHGKIIISDFNSAQVTPEVFLITYKARKEKGNQKNYSLRSSIWKLIDNHWQIIFHQGTVVKED
jgi:hypothetical protein